MSRLTRTQPRHVEASLLPSEWVRGLSARLTTRAIDLDQVLAEVEQVFTENDSRPTFRAVCLTSAVAELAVALRLAADGNHLEIGELLAELANMRDRGEI